MIVSCETLIYRLLCNFFSKTILIHRPRHRITNAIQCRAIQQRPAVQFNYLKQFIKRCNLVMLLYLIYSIYNLYYIYRLLLCIYSLYIIFSNRLNATPPRHTPRPASQCFTINICDTFEPNRATLHPLQILLFLYSLSAQFIIDYQIVRLFHPRFYGLFQRLKFYCPKPVTIYPIRTHCKRPIFVIKFVNF